MQPASPCTLCQGPHKARRCPELTDPLKEGFYKGGAPPSGGHDHDDEAISSAAVSQPSCVVAFFFSPHHMRY